MSGMICAMLGIPTSPRLVDGKTKNSNSRRASWVGLPGRLEGGTASASIVSAAAVLQQLPGVGPKTAAKVLVAVLRDGPQALQEKLPKKALQEVWRVAAAR